MIMTDYGEPSRKEIGYLLSYIAGYYLLLLSTFVLTTNGMIFVQLNTPTLSKIPYFLNYGLGQGFQNEIAGYYAFSLIIILVFHVIPVIEMKNLRDIRFTGLFVLFLLFWLFGMDGRGLKLSQMQIGDFSAALFYCFLIPLIQLFLFWLSGLVYEKRNDHS